MDRLEATIRRHFYHPRLRQEIRQQIGTCDTCQRMKRDGQQFGNLAPREALVSPWQEAHVDSIGPWKLKIRGVSIEFRAQTIIDPVTNLLEIAPIQGTTSAEAAHVFEQTWLSRYPRPLRCVHDKGPEFMGFEFQHLLPTPASSRNRSQLPTLKATESSNKYTRRAEPLFGPWWQLLLQQMLPPPDG